MDYNFTYAVDDGQSESYSRTHNRVAIDQFIYNQNVIRVSGLPDERHKLEVKMERFSFFMLDSVVITHGTPDPTTDLPTSSTPTVTSTLPSVTEQ